MPDIELIAGQESLLRDFKSRTLAAIAGTGGGKTLLLYWWLHSRMEAYPGHTWGMAEPTYPLLSKVILNTSDPERPSLEEYFKAVGHNPQYHAVDRIMETHFGKIYLGSADNPGSMQGAALKGYALDEAGLMKLLAFYTALQRTSAQEGQVFLATTPYNMGWLKTEIFDRAGDDVHVETWRSIDRPGFPLGEYEAMRQRLPSWLFAMLYDAQFERPIGLVYDSFDSKQCIKDSFPIDKSWPVYVGHDFGRANPAAMFYAVVPTSGDIFPFAEYLPGSKSVSDQVEDFKKITLGLNVIRRVGGNPQEQGWRDDYTAHGWPISEPKIKDPKLRIARVYAMHKLNKIFPFSDLRHYLDEKMSFSYKLNDNYTVDEKIENEEAYHLMSAEGYILSDFTPETAIRPAAPRHT